MMLELTKRPLKGKIGRDSYFSQVLGAAMSHSFTGVIIIKTAEAQARAYFQVGAPAHVVGDLFEGDRLGELLLAEGVVSQSTVEAAVTKRAQIDKPIGQILSEAESVNAAIIQSALKAQISKRINKLIGLTYGTWESEIGAFKEILPLMLPIDPWNLLLPGIVESSNEKELRKLSDSFLGKAVVITGPQDAVDRLRGHEMDDKVLTWLQQPRRPEQIERKLKDRRRVRAVYAALSALGMLELCPATEGRALIDKATADKVLHNPQRPPEKRAATDVKEIRGAPGGGRAPAPTPQIRRESKEEQAIREFFATIQGQNHFELFGMDPKDMFEEGELRKRFSTIAKKFHPDTLSQKKVSEEIQTMARDILSTFNDAYATLTDAKKRAIYHNAIASGDMPADESQKARAQAAKVKFDMALVMIKKKDYKKARELLKMATTMDPSNGAYKVHYGWAFYADPSFDREQATKRAAELLEKGIETVGKDALAHYYYGVVAKTQGDQKKAEKAFVKALKIDRKLHEAERELRLIMMRNKHPQSSGDKDKKGGLGRFFKFSK